jgi:peptide/nickel transport system substrate-binding protein
VRAGTRRTTAAALVAITLAAGCGDSDDRSEEDEEPGTEANQAAPTDEGEAVDGGVLVVALPGEIDGMNPTSNRWSIEGNMIGSAIFDPLMTFDEERNLVPHLAESVEPNGDGTVWTIKVPEGITFHDGSALNADAVAMNIQLRKDNPVSGGALESIESVEAVDDLTVEVTMNTPWFGYDYTLAAQGGYIAAPSQLESENPSALAIGTGPFKMQNPFSPGQSIEVERNEEYWGDVAHLDGIEFTAVLDPQSAQNALTSNTVDMIVTEYPRAIRELRESDGIVMVEDVAAEEGFIMLNLGKPPFDNEHARMALALATDQEGYIATLGEDVWIPATGPFTDSEAYASEDDGYPAFDVEAAKAEVAAYEEEVGQPLSFTISSSQGQNQEIANAVAGQWIDAGIDAQVETLEQSTFISNAFFGEFEAAVFRNFGYVNPDSNFIFWHSSQAKGLGTGSINFGQMKNPELDALLEDARANPDDADRVEAYQELTPLLNEMLPYIWLNHANWALAARDAVGGLSIPRELGFARQDAKPWWNKLWLAQS